MILLDNIFPAKDRVVRVSASKAVDWDLISSRVKLSDEHGRRLRVCGHAVHAHTFGYIMKNTLQKFFLGLNNITFC